MANKSLRTLKKLAIPFVLLAIVTSYIFALTQYAQHRRSSPMSFQPNSSTLVKVNIPHSSDEHGIYASFNDILSGKRRIVEADPMKAHSQYAIQFDLNSPASSLIYIDDEVLEVFLIPEDTLVINIDFNPETYRMDHVTFKGVTADMCQYFFEKSAELGQVNIRSSRNVVDCSDPVVYAKLLDSLALKELSFLKAYQQSHSLPEWFSNYEQSEIVYQKAYLKLSHPLNRSTDESYFDKVKLNNERAIFSYYYYHYLRMYISQLSDEVDLACLKPEESQRVMAINQLAEAEKILTGEVLDVFLCQVIIRNMNMKRDEVVKELLDRAYTHNFEGETYYRYIKTRLQEAQNMN